MKSKTNLPSELRNKLGRKLSDKGWGILSEVHTIQPDAFIRELEDISPDSINIVIRVHREWGCSAILLEIEKQLLEIARKNHIRLNPSLSESLQLKLSRERPELHGTRTRRSELPITLFQTINDASQSSKKKIIIALAANNDFMTELADFLSPIMNILPEKAYIFLIPILDKSPLKASQFHFREDNDYWKNPTWLGNDLVFFQEISTPDIVDYLTLDKVITILRLWDASDIVVPCLLSALDRIETYYPEQVLLITREDTVRLLAPIGPLDKHVAEYRLYRELIYFMLLNKKTLVEEYITRAFGAIEKSASISDQEKSIGKALIWGDIAQAAHEEGGFADALHAINQQKKLLKKAGLDAKGKIALTSVIFNEALVYKDKGQPDKASAILNKLIRDAQTRGDEYDELHISLELARLFHDREEYNRARVTFIRVLELANDKHTRGIALGYLALIDLNTSHIQEAYENARKALAIFETVGANADADMAKQLIEHIISARK